MSANPFKKLMKGQGGGLRTMEVKPIDRARAEARGGYQSSNPFAPKKGGGLRTMEVKPEDRARMQKMKDVEKMDFSPEAIMKRSPVGRARNINDINNTAVAKVDGDPKFGFKTILPASKVPLPTAPAVVGGNRSWKERKVSPITQVLHSKLSEARMMRSMPALDTPLQLEEPNTNSIHNTM